MTNKAGWERITKIEPQIWLDQSGSREFEMVWIVTADSIYQRPILVGETAESVAHHYAMRGYTDSQCVFFKVAGE